MDWVSDNLYSARDWTQDFLFGEEESGEQKENNNTLAGLDRSPCDFEVPAGFHIDENLLADAEKYCKEFLSTNEDIEQI
jgi:hypothetical protein